jgi:hypothetical protein
MLTDGCAITILANVSLTTMLTDRCATTILAKVSLTTMLTLIFLSTFLSYFFALQARFTACSLINFKLIHSMTQALAPITFDIFRFHNVFIVFLLHLFIQLIILVSEESRELILFLKFFV